MIENALDVDRVRGSPAAAISVFRGAFDRIALWLGIDYPPALLLLALIVLVFVAG